MNRSSSGPTLVFLTVLASVLLGLSVIQSPGVALPFSIELILLLALTLWGLGREPDPDIRKWLFRLVLAALALRLLLVLVVQFRLSPYFFAPDAEGYERVSQQISNYWAGEGFAPQAIREGWRPGYYHLNAVFYSAFGDSRLALVVLNMFAGVWTALTTFYLTKEFLPTASAKAAALITGLFSVVGPLVGPQHSRCVSGLLHGNARPCMVPPDQAIPTFLPLDFFRVPTRPRSAQGLHGFSRNPGAHDRKRDRGPSGTHVGTMVFGTITALVLTYLADQVGLIFDRTARGTSRDGAGLAARTSQDATSAFGLGAETRTVGAALQYIPIGGAYLLFAPFPWDIQTALQTTAMGETFLWYPLFFLAVLGFRISLRDRVTTALFPASVLLVVVTSYALVEGNFGRRIGIGPRSCRSSSFFRASGSPGSRCVSSARRSGGGRGPGDYRSP